jgi:hypothetical protein
MIRGYVEGVTRPTQGAASWMGESRHAATIAIVAEPTIEQLWDAVPAFPTLSGVWLRLGELGRHDRER